MHKIRHFSERLECWLFRDSFTETLLHIGEPHNLSLKHIVTMMFPHGDELHKLIRDYRDVSHKSESQKLLYKVIHAHQL